VPVWGRLDASAPWQEFAQGAGAPALLQEVERFRPDVALGVDWTSLKVAGPSLVRLGLPWSGLAGMGDASSLPHLPACLVISPQQKRCCSRPGANGLTKAQAPDQTQSPMQDVCRPAGV
jgi:hypothetical protein